MTIFILEGFAGLNLYKGGNFSKKSPENEDISQSCRYIIFAVCPLQIELKSCNINRWYCT